MTRVLGGSDGVALERSVRSLLHESIVSAVTGELAWLTFSGRSCQVIMHLDVPGTSVDDVCCRSLVKWSPDRQLRDNGTSAVPCAWP